MKKFILALDQGTTGSTALIIDADTLEILEKDNFEFKQYYPKPGWVEHDLNEIFDSIKKSIVSVLNKSGIDKNQIQSIAITNQRETTCAFDKDGKPLTKAIVWQDRRTANICQELKSNYEAYRKKTGLPLDPYFSGTKMKWFLENSNEVKTAAETNNLCFGTIDTFLLYKLTSCKSFKTEASNASRTLLMNLETCDWDSELLKFFNIDQTFLPEISDSFTEFGKTEGLTFLPDGIPILSILGDQQAALFGQAGFQKGSLKCTYGTGAFILLNTGEDIIHSDKGLLTTVAYKKEGKPCYALEGSSYIAGAAVQYLRDNLKIIKTSPEVEVLANKVDDLEQMADVLFLPFFTGIGSPYWVSDAKAALIGLTRGTENSHIARATLEGIALSINDSISVLIDESPEEVKQIKVDGGACANNLLMQLQSDISEKEIIRPKVIETTAYGVALGSLLCNSSFDMNSLLDLWKLDKTFKPSKSDYISHKKSIWTTFIKNNFL
jgi:glycerol kinase